MNLRDKIYHIIWRSVWDIMHESVRKSLNQTSKDALVGRCKDFVGEDVWRPVENCVSVSVQDCVKFNFI